MIFCSYQKISSFPPGRIQGTLFMLSETKTNRLARQELSWLAARIKYILLSMPTTFRPTCSSLSKIDPACWANFKAITIQDCNEASRYPFFNHQTITDSFSFKSYRNRAMATKSTQLPSAKKMPNITKIETKRKRGQSSSANNMATRRGGGEERGMSTREVWNNQFMLPPPAHFARSPLHGELPFWSPPLSILSSRSLPSPQQAPSTFPILVAVIIPSVGDLQGSSEATFCEIPNLWR